MPARRSTRSTKALASFALGYDGNVEIKSEQAASDNESIPDTTFTPDIEDALPAASPARTSRKRKLGADSPSTSIVSTTITSRESTLTSPSKNQIKDEPDTDSVASPSSRARAKPKFPARKTTSATTGEVMIHPPSNWSEMYNIIQTMRKRNPIAPVDTMGCEDLFWRGAPEKQKRYHTLTALMLSSQTKDTVTAAAMQRLHTELIPQKGDPTTGRIEHSGLTVDNVLACDAKWLDELIGKVGFHNNKTRFIKAAAQMLRDEYDSDIPPSVEGLMRLPGVGPKMAYLCMSAAWGIDEGIGVDVHVHRITNLWGWHNTKTPEETRAWLEGWLPRDKWHEINKMLVGLGQTVCLPVGRRCGECDLAGTGLCKSEVRGIKVKERRVKVEKVKKDEEGKPETEVMKVEKSVQIKEELVDS